MKHRASLETVVDPHSFFASHSSLLHSDDVHPAGFRRGQQIPPSKSKRGQVELPNKQGRERSLGFTTPPGLLGGPRVRLYSFASQVTLPSSRSLLRRGLRDLSIGNTHSSSGALTRLKRGICSDALSFPGSEAGSAAKPCSFRHWAFLAAALRFVASD